ncbi:MAG: HD domain-containing protein [Actinobacteria bacterium]|nr:HD domain-containing protein [Actinomycetota bacterium]
MSGPDRRHALDVARRAVAVLGSQATRPVLAAALLHDVGKIDAGLGTLLRVPATVAGLVARERLAGGDGRLARYLRHDAIGAGLLADAGAHPLTVAWAAEHHQPPATWTVPPEVGRALKAADDD